MRDKKSIYRLPCSIASLITLLQFIKAQSVTHYFLKWNGRFIDQDQLNFDFYGIKQRSKRLEYINLILNLLI